MTTSDRGYVVAGCRPWNRTVFDDTISRFDGDWTFIGHRKDLTAESLQALAPRFVFFLHWSWIVPSSIIDSFECVCFHMTDLPYGRGGSPLQNLIVRGHRNTVMTAFKMTDELDAGPVYLKRPLNLDGSAREIYVRATELSAAMIKQIIAEEIEPSPQFGEVTPFARRTPLQSEIMGDHVNLQQIHDHIRMLDAEGYPPAFIRVGALTFSLKNSVLEPGVVRAVVEITHTPSEE